MIQVYFHSYIKLLLSLGTDLIHQSVRRYILSSQEAFFFVLSLIIEGFICIWYRMHMIELCP